MIRNIVGGILAGLGLHKEKHPVIGENHRIFAGFDRNAKLGDCEFTVVDTELTGLDPHKDEIVSIGAVGIRNLSIVPGKSFYSPVKPRIEMPKTSTLIHRITPAELAEAPDISEVLPLFLQFAGKTAFIGHFIGLDMGFINKAANNLYGGLLKTPCLDTARMAHVYDEKQGRMLGNEYKTGFSYFLGDLAERYALPVFPRHNALQDAFQTAYLFVFLAGKLRGSGIETLNDLFMAGWGLRGYF